MQTGNGIYMTIYHSFDKRIERFLREQPGSNSSRVIKKLKMHYPECDTYFDIYDTFFSKLGVSFGSFPIFVGKSENVNSYIPVINYSEGNLLNEKSRKEKLYDVNSIITLNKCYEYLAKALTYKIVKIENLEELINITLTGIGKTNNNNV